jgi:hypothetical protein
MLASSPASILNQTISTLGIPSRFGFNSSRSRPLGIFIVLVFIGLLIVVRTAQPVPQDSERGVEEASATPRPVAARPCSASCPAFVPALLTGGRSPSPALHGIRKRYFPRPRGTFKRADCRLLDRWRVHSPLRAIENRMG